MLRESVRDAGAFGDPGFQVPPTAPAGPQKARNKHVFVAEVIISGALVGLEATKAPGAERSGSSAGISDAAQRSHLGGGGDPSAPLRERRGREGVKVARVWEAGRKGDAE